MPIFHDATSKWMHFLVDGDLIMIHLTQASANGDCAY